MNKKRTGWPEISRVEVIIVLAFLSSVHPIMTDEVLGQAEYVIFDMDGLLSVSDADIADQRWKAVWASNTLFDGSNSPVIPR
jgi:hypothetical protein